MACLAVALLAQLLLPAMHAMVHHREQHGVRERHGDRERAWIITKAGGRVVSAPQHAVPREHSHGQGAPVHRHGAPEGDLASGGHEHGPGHHHDGDQPGDRHGAHSLEHLTAFFLEATPPRLAIPYRLVAAPTVTLVAGRLMVPPIDRAQPVRGPPQAS